ncbi:MAG: Uma2 family endonuclease [Chloroflexota bacterium]
MLTEATDLSAADRRFLYTFACDEEDAPWMSVAEWHQLALIAVLLPLRWLRDRLYPEWYVGSEMSVYYRTAEGTKKFVAPDLFVALASRHERASFDVEEEGGFPRFVLEIVSEESLARDTGPAEKVRLYGLLGAQEYVIFDPVGRMQPQLRGYHRDPYGRWVAWEPGPRGELISNVLGVTLVGEGRLLRLEDAQGRRLLTADEEHARADREQAQAQRERARAEAAEARVAELEARIRGGQSPS